MGQPYGKKYTKEAAKQLDLCLADYGAEVHEQLFNWQKTIIESANSRQDLDHVSLALDDFLERLSGDLKDDLSSFSTWKRKSFIEKLSGLLFWIREQRQPWMVRVSVNPILVFHKIVESSAIIEIDHIRKRVVFRLFIDLPGQ